MTESPSDLRSMSLGAYLDELSAAVPVPGGGAVAGVTLAQSAALGAMVVGYAIGRPKFAAHDAAHRAAQATLARSMRRAIELAEEDARAYRALNGLWKLPKTDPARAGFGEAVLAAIAAPEATLALAADTVAALGALAGTTSPSLASDLRIALDLASAGARAAIENVRINLPSVEDPVLRAAIAARTEGALSEVLAAASCAMASIGA